MKLTDLKKFEVALNTEILLLAVIIYHFVMRSSYARKQIYWRVDFAT